MPKTRKLTFTCPATVEDRAVKSGNLKLGIDPSTEGFLLKSKAREQMLSMQLVPGADHREIKPIPLAGVVKSITLVFQDVAVPDKRLADLDFLIRDEHAGVELRVEAEHADLFEDLPEDGD